jgi:hypothetical protein
MKIQACDSCCRGFESHQPPQEFAVETKGYMLCAYDLFVFRLAVSFVAGTCKLLVTLADRHVIS